MTTGRSELSATLAVLVVFSAVSVGAMPATARSDGAIESGHNHSQEDEERHTHEDKKQHSHEESGDHTHEEGDHSTDDETGEDGVIPQSVLNQSRVFVHLDEPPTVVIVTESDRLATESARSNLETLVERFFGRHADRGRIGAVNAVVEHVERVGTEGGAVPVDPESIVEDARENGELGTNGRIDLSGIDDEALESVSVNGAGNVFEIPLPAGPSERDITSGANGPGGVMMGGGIGTGGDGIETPDGAASDSGGGADVSGHVNAAAGGLVCWAICSAADGTLPIADAGCAVTCSLGYYQGQQEAKEDIQESDADGEAPDANDDSDTGDKSDHSDTDSSETDSSSSDSGDSDDSSSSDNSNDDSSSSDSGDSDDSSDADSSDAEDGSNPGDSNGDSSSDGSQDTGTAGMPVGPNGPGSGCGPRMHCREDRDVVVEVDPGNDVKEECTVMMPTGPGGRCGGQNETTVVVEVDPGNDIEEECTVMMPTGPGGECGTDGLQSGQNGAVGKRDHCRYMMPTGPDGACSEDGSGQYEGATGETGRPGGGRGPGRTGPTGR